MTTTFFLVRHATHDLVDRVLPGRSGGAPLAAAGHRQAEELAAHFAALGITAVQSSPRERAEQTARPIAERASVPCETIAALDEVDVGAWSGLTFEELDRDPAWHAWNSDRHRTRAPGGEAMTDVQERLLGHLRDSCTRHPEARLVLVSHADVIKTALLHFLGTDLDGYGRIEIAPAGISTLVIGDWGGKIVSLNERVAV